VEQINTLIPSSGYLKFLKYFTGWFNRDIDSYIPEEYKEEIYGVSFSAADGYEYIGSKYDRMLNYHAAHDIGHALQSLMLVGCTSFAANMGTSDSSLIVGRNFDFYINEAFAEDKIVVFVHPDKGIDFVYVTWASMIGVVSGINTRGLTVTINAAKSDIPVKATTPISLLAREILQYAGNINEAIAIAEKRQTFVAESLLIGSAEDNRAVIIEKSPSRLGVFSTDNPSLVCSNHFQSEVYRNDPANSAYMEESASVYRQLRCEQLLNQVDVPDVIDAVGVLRDYRGLDNVSIGVGNEKTMAQMISHHSVVFKPLRQQLWVSTAPWQLGAYLGYQIESVFNTGAGYNGAYPLYDSTLIIPADSFLQTSEFEDFTLFRAQREEVKSWIKEKSMHDEEEFETFIYLNPEYYQGYVLTGNYFFVMGDTALSNKYYRLALTKEMENTATAELIKARLSVE
jgi:predicted choloylglycine hydrolase